MKSILSEIVGKYSRHSETICSESLALIINQSALMQKAFNLLVIKKSNGLLTLGDGFMINAQVTSKKDAAIPDLEIQTDQKHKHLIEAKFWAGLTDHQPNSYIKRILGSDEGGSLIFLAPVRRIVALKLETMKRAKEEFEILENTQGYLVENKVHVVFLSWTETLEELWNFAKNVDDKESIYNLYQLKMLVKKLDSEGFLPFDPVLFTPAAAKQRDQLVDLIDDIIKNTPMLVKGKLSYGGGKYSIQNYFKLNNKIGGYLMYSSDLWMKYQETPLFFCLSQKDWDTKEQISNLSEIQIALSEDGIKFIFEDERESQNPSLMIMLNVKMGLDKDGTYQNLQNQVDHIVQVLKPFTM